MWKARITGFVFALVALTFSLGHASAQTLFITPALVDSSTPVEQALAENKGHASVTLEGQGAALVIEYRSTEPLEVYMVPLADNDSFVPTDYMRFTLPITDDATVSVDLTVSPGWSPANQRYLVQLLSKTEDAGAAFTQVSFEPTSWSGNISAALRQFGTREIYTPSSFHALRGYRVFSTPTAVVFGLLTLIMVLVCGFVVPKKNRMMSLLCVTIGMSFVYQLRFSVDLLRFTSQHLQEYVNGTYDEAGSVHLIARDVLALAAEQKTAGRDPLVFVCRDGTNFKEKLLRYFAYPVPISSQEADANKVTIVALMNKLAWKFDTTLSVLSCGPINVRAKQKETYPDGSVLFEILPPQK
jgi:hypothetical protein